MFLVKITSILNSASGNVNYTGEPHWAYWLMGGILLFVSIFFAYLIYRWRDRNSHEHLSHTYGEFKKFWYKNRFAIMILLTVVVFACSIFFFLMNGVIIKYK